MRTTHNEGTNGVNSQRIHIKCMVHSVARAFAARGKVINRGVMGRAIIAIMFGMCTKTKFEHNYISRPSFTARGKVINRGVMGYIMFGTKTSS